CDRFFSMRIARFVQRPSLEHRDQDSKETVGDAAEGAAMTMAALPQTVVIGTAGGGMLEAGANPVVSRLAQVRVARAPHRHQQARATFAAPRRHGRGAGPQPQGAIIAIGQRPCGLSEHRREDFSPDAWQGPEDGHVAMLAAVAVSRWLRLEF